MNTNWKDYEDSTKSESCTSESSNDKSFNDKKTNSILKKLHGHILSKEVTVAGLLSTKPFAETTTQSLNKLSESLSIKSVTENWNSINQSPQLYRKIFNIRRAHYREVERKTWALSNHLSQTQLQNLPKHSPVFYIQNSLKDECCESSTGGGFNSDSERFVKVFHIERKKISRSPITNHLSAWQEESQKFRKYFIIQRNKRERKRILKLSDLENRKSAFQSFSSIKAVDINSCNEVVKKMSEFLSKKALAICSNSPVFNLFRSSQTDSLRPELKISLASKLLELNRPTKRIEDISLAAQNGKLYIPKARYC